MMWPQWTVCLETVWFGDSLSGDSLSGDSLVWRQFVWRQFVWRQFGLETVCLCCTLQSEINERPADVFLFHSSDLQHCWTWEPAGTRTLEPAHLEAAVVDAIDWTSSSCCDASTYQQPMSFYPERVRQLQRRLHPTGPDILSSRSPRQHEEDNVQILLLTLLSCRRFLRCVNGIRLTDVFMTSLTVCLAIFVQNILTFYFCCHPTHLMEDDLKELAKKYWHWLWQSFSTDLL